MIKKKRERERERKQKSKPRERTRNTDWGEKKHTQLLTEIKATLEAVEWGQLAIDGNRKLYSNVCEALQERKRNQGPFIMQIQVTESFHIFNNLESTPHIYIWGGEEMRAGKYVKAKQKINRGLIMRNQSILR